MTTKPHPTDAMEMAEMPFVQTEENLLSWCRAERIAAYNLGRESMREEAAKKCHETAAPYERNPTQYRDGYIDGFNRGADQCEREIRSIEL